MSNNSFFKIGFFVFLVLFLVAVGAAGAWFYFSYQTPAKNEETSTSTPAQPTPTETAEPTIVPSPALTTTPTLPAKSALEQIQAAIAAKYSKPIDETTVSLSENNGTHAKGGVKFTGEIAGAWLLAAKVNDGWVIVQDGNGTVSCETIEPFNFPPAMVPECVDNNGSLITR